MCIANRGVGLPEKSIRISLPGRRTQKVGHATAFFSLKVEAPLHPENGRPSTIVILTTGISGPVFVILAAAAKALPTLTIFLAPCIRGVQSSITAAFTLAVRALRTGAMPISATPPQSP